MNSASLQPRCSRNSDSLRRATPEYCPPFARLMSVVCSSFVSGMTHMLANGK